jgi:hypothetical protein
MQHTGKLLLLQLSASVALQNVVARLLLARQLFTTEPMFCFRHFVWKHNDQRLLKREAKAVPPVDAAYHCKLLLLQ